MVGSLTSTVQLLHIFSFVTRHLNRRCAFIDMHACLLGMNLHLASRGFCGVGSVNGRLRKIELACLEKVMTMTLMCNIDDIFFTRSVLYLLCE